MLAGNDDPNLPLVTCSQDDNTGVSAGQVDHQRRADRERHVGLDQQRGEYVVDLQFKGDAANVWADFTAANVGTQTAFVLDSQVVSAPEIQEAIPGRPHPDHRPVHRRLGPRTGQRAEVRLAAAVVRVLGGRNRLGHTGFDVAAGGPDRGCDRAGAGAAVLAALLPGARAADRVVAGRFGRNGFRDPGAARQIHRLHARPGRHRRSDHRYRHHGRLVRGVLRTHQRRDPRRPFVPIGRAARLGTGPQDDPVRQRGHVPGRGGALRPGGRTGEGLRVHAWG